MARKIKAYRTFSALSLTLLITSMFLTVGVQPAFSEIELPQPGIFDYVVFTNATSTYAEDTTTGEIVSQNQNATELFSSIPQGTSWLIEPGTYFGVIAINQSSTSVTGSGIDSTVIVCPEGVYRNCIQAIGDSENSLTDIYVGSLTVNGQWDLNATNPPQGQCAEPDELQQCGVSLQYVSNATIAGVKAYNIPWDGLQAYRCEYVKYINCTAYMCRWEGFQFWSSTVHSTMNNCNANMTATGAIIEFGSNYSSMSNMVINNSGVWGTTWGGSAGILIGYGVNGVRVTNVQIYNAPFGMSIFDSFPRYSYNLTVEGARIENSYLDGFYVQGIGDTTIMNSIVNGSGWNNLYSESSSNVTVSNCTFTGSGINLTTNSNYWNITDDTFQNCGPTNSAITIGDSTCTGNMITGCNFIDCQGNPITNLGTGTIIINEDSPVPSNIFGYSTVGENFNCFGAAVIEGCKFTSPANCDAITKISAHISAFSGTTNAYALIYSDNSGVPTNLLAISSEATGITTTPSWVNFTINYAASPNTAYWLVLMTSTDINFWHTSGSTVQSFFGQSFEFPIASTNIPASFTPIYYSAKQSIYATYSTNPIVNYLHVWGIPAGQSAEGLVDPAGAVSNGQTIRFFASLSDPETTQDHLTVTFEYKAQTDSVWTTATASWEPLWGSFWYYDWLIPASAPLGLYDLRVVASDGDGGLTTATQTSAFSVQNEL